MQYWWKGNSLYSEPLVNVITQHLQTYKQTGSEIPCLKLGINLKKFHNRLFFHIIKHLFDLSILNISCQKKTYLYGWVATLQIKPYQQCLYLLVPISLYLPILLLARLFLYILQLSTELYSLFNVTLLPHSLTKINRAFCSFIKIVLKTSWKSMFLSTQMLTHVLPGNSYSVYNFIKLGSVPAKAIWRTIGPAPCQFGPKVFEKI